jgi:photosystem II stability/assembly factor-like uncharacterized protein
MKRVFAFVTVATLAAGVCASYATSWWTKCQNSPTEGDINAVSLLDANNGRAVGDWGLILRLQAGKWSIFHTWPTQSLHDVSFGTANFGMAVGYRGSGCFFNGTRWIAANIPTTLNMFAVAFLSGSPNTAWAVGERGGVWRWNGAWSRWPIGTTANLRDIHFNSTNGWICGDNGLVYHFSGSMWNAVNISTSEDLYCIFADSTNDFWVGGTNGYLYHSRWGRINTPTNATIRDLSFPDVNVGWAVCDGGTILRCDGGQCKKECTNPPTNKDFYGIDMASARKGWAVGAGGIIYEYRRFPAVSPASLGRVKALFR